MEKVFENLLEDLDSGEEVKTKYGVCYAYSPDIVEKLKQALAELKAIKEAKPSEALDYLYNSKMFKYVGDETYFYQQYNVVKSAQLKTQELEKENAEYKRDLAAKDLIIIELLNEKKLSEEEKKEIEKLDIFTEIRKAIVEMPKKPNFIMKEADVVGVKLSSDMLDKLTEDSYFATTEKDYRNATLMGVKVYLDETVNRPKYIVEGEIIARVNPVVLKGSSIKNYSIDEVVKPSKLFEEDEGLDNETR